MNKSVIIGLTGPTGAGKSTACKAAEDLGFAVIDADRVSREVTEKGSLLLPVLQKEFGNVLNSDGTLCRQKLAAAAFLTPESTERLNKIMLPAILKRIKRHISRLQDEEKRLILLDAPTLFEAGADSLCTATAAVIAPKAERMERIIKRDNLSKAAAELRINAGKDDSFYFERCDKILENNGTKVELYRNACRFFEGFLPKE